MHICEECRKREKVRKPASQTTDVCDLCGRKRSVYTVHESEVMWVPKAKSLHDTYRTIYVDASVDRMGNGVIAILSRGFVKVSGSFPDITSSEAEFLAAATALRDFPNQDILLVTDHLPLADTINNRNDTNGKLGHLYEKIVESIEGRKVVFKWVQRRYNDAGRFLEMMKIRFTKRGNLYPVTFNLEIIEE